VIGAELDLVLGQDHPVRELAPHLALLELQTAGKPCARESHRHGCTRAEVPGPADNLPRVALPHVHAAELEPVGVRVLLRLEHAARP
jgi:hypothetical protein